MDVKLCDEGYRVYSLGGRVKTDIDAIEWAKFGEESGAGELVINSIDTDGVKNGFDLPLLEKIVNAVNIPVIASGGAGSVEHFKELFKRVNVDAGLGASVFHYKDFTIGQLKRELKSSGVEVRI